MNSEWRISSAPALTLSRLSFVCLLLGLAFVRVSRFTVSAFLAGISYFIATLTYAFVDGRFYLPLFFLLIALAVLPVEWAVFKALKLRFSISMVGVLTIFLLTCIGYPSQSGFKPKRNRSQAWDALQYATGNGRSPRYEAQEEFSRSFRDAPGIVLSDIDPPYLNVLVAEAIRGGANRRSTITIVTAGCGVTAKPKRSD